MGKFAFRKLSEIIGCVKPSSRVLVPPTPGCDAGVYRFDDDRYMIVSTDPCTGVPEDWFGWLLIHYPSSDVALFGAHPTLASVNLLGPEGTSYKVYRRIMYQACKTAEESNIDIITGHTGNYPSLHQIVGICTVLGFVGKGKLITPSNSKPGDLVLMIKPLGLETLTNFSFTNYEKSKRLFGSKKAQGLRSMIKAQTCVNEALLLAECGGVHAMHDTTEGGLVAALNEMADTSHLGFEVIYENIPIKEEMRSLQDYFRLSMVELLSTSSTGCLIASISPYEKDEITNALTEKGLANGIIGRFSQGKGRYINIKNRRVRFPSEARDPYTKIFYSR